MKQERIGKFLNNYPKRFRLNTYDNSIMHHYYFRNMRQRRKVDEAEGWIKYTVFLIRESMK